GARYLEIFKKSSILLFILYPENKERVLANMEAILQTNNLCKDFKKQRAVNKGYRPKCVSVLACVPLWRWAFLLFELYGRGTRGRPECVSGMAGQALRHNG
ncbi:hypothetical protein, partial [Bifidobacterium animalis]|uniref:hypothetical protein n=1 Tax=Bifidobacterium animalis TaxID=28025 RepID=UPI001C5B5B96